MGIEIDLEFGGVGSNFMTTIISIEELAKVDPSVALLVDIHNTLVNAVIKKLGTNAQKEKYLPMLASNTVSKAYTINLIGELSIRFIVIV